MRSAKSGFGFGVGMALGIALILAAAVGLYVLADKNGWIATTVPAMPKRRIDPKADAALLKRDADARKAANSQLRRWGIMAVSDDAKTVDDGLLTCLVGTGKDKDGRLREIIVSFRVGHFGTANEWAIESVAIDGNEVYKSPH